MVDVIRAEYDVLIVGGGPAGATAATILAQHGRRVLLLEKESFPRYHVGESLLPFCYFPLQRLGLIEKMKASHFPVKLAVQFVSTQGKVAMPFYFFQHMDHEASKTWQVLRSEFDAMLLENARSQGAQVRTETEVIDFLRREDQIVGVRAVCRDEAPKEIYAPLTIDASGRQALAIKKNDWCQWDPHLNKVALWTYFRGAKRDPGLDAGSTTIAYLPQKSWFWYIPLPEEQVSVGIVAERDYLFGAGNDLPAIFCREVGKNPWIAEHLAPGQQFGRYYATKEFSYRSRHCAQDGLVLVGDAFAFLDPVFSSGVYLALRSGELAADAAHKALEAGDFSARRFQDYSEQIRGELEAMRKLVNAFYDQAFSFGRLIKAHPEVRGDLTDCLIGNLAKDFTQLFDAVQEMATLPPSLPYGGPLVATPHLPCRPA